MNKKFPQNVEGTSWEENAFGHSQRQCTGQAEYASIQSSYLCVSVAWGCVGWTSGAEESWVHMGHKQTVLGRGAGEEMEMMYCMLRMKEHHKGLHVSQTCGTELSPGGKASPFSIAVDAINTDCKLRNLSEEPHQKRKQMLPAVSIQMTVPGWATVY